MPIPFKKNAKKGDYSPAEVAEIKYQTGVFVRKRALIIKKLRALKKKNGWTNADLDKRGLYPHKLLDPIFGNKQADVQAIGGLDSPLLVIPGVINVVNNAINPNVNPAGELNRYGGADGITAADAELEKALQEVEDRMAEEKYEKDEKDDIDEHSSALGTGQVIDDQIRHEELDEKFDDAADVRARIKRTQKHKIKTDTKRRKMRDNEVYIINITKLLQTLLDQGDRGSDNNDLSIFATEDVIRSDRKQIMVKLWSDMSLDVKQKILDLFTRLGVDFSTPMGRGAGNQLYDQLNTGYGHNFNDGLTPAQRRVNLMGRLRELFTSQLNKTDDDKPFTKKEITASELKKLLSKGTKTVRPDRVEAPIPQLIDQARLDADLVDLSEQIRDARVPEFQTQQIVELLRDAFSDGVMTEYNSGTPWEEAQQVAYVGSLNEIVGILQTLKRDTGVDFSTQNIISLIKYIGRSIKHAPDIDIKTSGLLKKTIEIVAGKGDGSSSAPPPTVREAMRPEQRAQNDADEKELLNAPPGERRGIARSILNNLLKTRRIAGTAVRVRLFGRDVAIGVPRMTNAQLKTYYNNRSREQLLEIAKRKLPGRQWESATADEIRTALLDTPQPDSWEDPDPEPDWQEWGERGDFSDQSGSGSGYGDFSSGGGGPPEDPDRGFFISINNNPRVIKLSLFIAIMTALGVSAKKIKDYVDGLKDAKGKDIAIDIPGTDKPSDKPVTPDDFPPYIPSGDFPPSVPGVPYYPDKREEYDGEDWDVPDTIGDDTSYTNMAKDFLEDPLVGMGYTDFNLPPPDPVLGAEHMNLDLIPDTEKYKHVRAAAVKYNAVVNEYNQNIADYETWTVYQKPAGIWGNPSYPNPEQENITLATKTMPMFSEDIKKSLQSTQTLLGDTSSPNLSDSFKPVWYEVARYANGSVSKYATLDKSKLSYQLGLDTQIDEYNDMIKQYNAEVDKFISENPSGNGQSMPQLPKSIVAIKNKLAVKMNSISDITKNKQSRVGRVESREIEYSTDDKNVIDKIIATGIRPGEARGVELTDSEERALRDNPKLYDMVMEMNRLSKQPKTSESYERIKNIRAEFDKIRANDYMPLSYVVPVSGDYDVAYDKNAEGLFIQSKTAYTNAVAKLHAAQASGKSKQINQLYQDMDIKRTDYETKRVKYQTSVNKWREGQTATTTYLADMDDEVIPRTEQERTAFNRLQNIESILQTNPEALSMYNERVKSISKNQRPVDIYMKRQRYLQQIASQYNLGDDFNRASTENMNINIKDMDDGDTIVDFDRQEEDIGEGFERAEAIDPAEATLFLSSRAEAIAEQKRWSEFSSVLPFNGLGDTRTNPLLRHQVRDNIARYGDTTKGAYPTRSEMRIRDRHSVIRKQQLLPQVSNQPFIPTIQVAFGKDHFENEFAIPTNLSGNNFTISDNNLPDNKFSTVFKPNTYNPEYALLKYNTDLSATGLNVGNNARESQYRFTNASQRPEYYTQTNREYLGATMDNNFGSDPRPISGSTINYKNVIRPGAEAVPVVSLYDDATIRSLASRRHR